MGKASYSGERKASVGAQHAAPAYEQIFSGSNGAGETPVPIPNTAVKPCSADGTAPSRGGRVGRRREYIKNVDEL